MGHITYYNNIIITHLGIHIVVYCSGDKIVLGNAFTQIAYHRIGIKHIGTSERSTTSMLHLDGMQGAGVLASHGE